MSADAIAAELASAMLKDTDVGKVVLGASFVDDLLSHLIQTRLIDDEVSRKLFSSNDTDRPFGLSVKSRLTFALGLISKSELDDILKLAKARNQVAHLRMSELLNNKDYKKKTLDPLRDISLSEREQLVAAHKEYLAAMQVNALVLTWTLANRVAENSSFLGPTERAEEIA